MAPQLVGGPWTDPICALRPGAHYRTGASGLWAGSEVFPDVSQFTFFTLKKERTFLECYQGLGFFLERYVAKKAISKNWIK